MINYESLIGNQGNIYPMAGWSIQPGRIVTGATTLDTTYYRVEADTTAAPFIITLPLDPQPALTYEIEDGAAAGSFGTNNLTIDGNGKSINGAGTLVLNANFASRFLRYNGTRWIVIAQGPV